MTNKIIWLTSDYFIDVDEMNHTLKKRYVGKDKDELLEMQIDETDGIIGWYTSENNLQLGLVGVL